MAPVNLYADYLFDYPKKRTSIAGCAIVLLILIFGSSSSAGFGRDLTSSPIPKPVSSIEVVNTLIDVEQRYSDIVLGDRATKTECVKLFGGSWKCAISFLSSSSGKIYRVALEVDVISANKAVVGRDFGGVAKIRNQWIHYYQIGLGGLAP